MRTRAFPYPGEIVQPIAIGNAQVRSRVACKRGVRVTEAGAADCPDAVASPDPLFGLEQAGFLSLIFGLRERSGVAGLLQIDELLAECTVALLGVAVADGDAAAQEQDGGKQNRCGEKGVDSFHKWRG